MIDALFTEDVAWVPMILALALVASIAALIAEGAARLTRTLLVRIGGGDYVADVRTPIVRRPIRITRAIIFMTVGASLIVPALEMAGARVPVGLNPVVLTGWFLGSGLRILIITLLTYLLVRVVAVCSRRLEDTISRESSPDAVEQIKRARTVSRLVQNALTTIVIVIAGLMGLRELDIDIMPVLTGAGIIGLAVGFGAQTLVKDLISGFFLILENQVRVGDVAIINGRGGLVEAINLRTVVLRDLEGIVHIVPNGSIESLSNMTKDFAYYVVNVGVAYKEDPDRVMELLRDIGAELAADPQYQPSILEPLEILGVDAFEESQITLKIRIKTLPLKQWEVGRELRRRIKKTFDAHGIEIPFPHMSVYFGEASRPFVLRQAS